MLFRTQRAEDKITRAGAAIRIATTSFANQYLFFLTGKYDKTVAAAIADRILNQLETAVERAAEAASLGNENQD